MDKEREDNIKKRILEFLKLKGAMSMSEIHQRTGISYYEIKDIIPTMVQQNQLLQEGKKLKIKEETNSDEF